ncbi:hypothetical protein [Acinetobacter pittii]|uniref:hypothetical protein n=1 Tax=Acinetobacter pittii TaxID=48296 RepID=UPI001F1FEF90|nr:hypothetical protein [Acinetobacter pittii]MCE6393426.1 hypothetical protein [Acinetobacter pittii]
MDMNELNKFLDCKNAFESAQQKIGGEAKEIYLEYFKAGTQHQQAKVEELQEEFAEDERFLKEQIQQKDITISGLKYLQKADKELIQALQIKTEKMQKRVDAAKGLAQTLWEKSNEKHRQGKVWESKALSECADEILDVIEQALKGEGQ